MGGRAPLSDLARGLLILHRLREAVHIEHMGTDMDAWRRQEGQLFAPLLHALQSRCGEEEEQHSQDPRQMAQAQ